jgi:hypothetical protein
MASTKVFNFPEYPYATAIGKNNGKGSRAVVATGLIPGDIATGFAILLLMTLLLVPELPGLVMRLVMLGPPLVLVMLMILIMPVVMVAYLLELSAMVLFLKHAP